MRDADFALPGLIEEAKVRGRARRHLMACGLVRIQMTIRRRMCMDVMRRRK
jgi:hypothetical protein